MRLRRTLLVSMLMTAAIAAVSTAAWAQSGGGAQRFELSGNIGAGRVFRFDDQSFGTKIDVGGGAEFRIRPRLRVAVDVSRLSGLAPREVDCSSLIGVACTGSGLAGVQSTTVLSGALVYVFDAGAIQPYVLGGVNVLWSRSLSTATIVRDDVGTIVQHEDRDRGFGPTAGFGVRVPLGPRVVVRPDVRLSSGSVMGRENLNVLRTSVAIGFAW
jgi:hypothetical protein